MPLWIGGLTLGVLFLAARVLPLSGEALEWGAYLMLGTVFPAVAVGITISRDRGPGRDRAARLVQIVAAMVAILSASTFIVRHGSAMLLALAGVTWLLGTALYRGRTGHAHAAMAPVELVVGLFLVTVAWTVSSRLTSWAPFEAVVSGSPYTLAVLVGASLLATVTLCRAATSGLRAPLRRTATGAALAVLAFASFRAEPLSGAAAHHWGVAIGPAELVRQGGWLLWDVPIQYGFLSTLVVALAPGQSIWDAFYFVQATLLFLSATVLFLLLRGPRPGLLDLAFALVSTVAVVFLLPGFPEDLTGSWVVPNVGPYRFFWCYALVTILFWQGHGHPARRPGVLAIGTLAWVAGTLWSAESAAYCAAIWLPAYVLIVLAERTRRGVVSTAKRLAVPPLALGATSLVVIGYYRVGLGHGPDWQAFGEYALIFAGGFATVRIDRQGAVWGLLLILALVATAGLRRLALHAAAPTLALAFGAWAAAWAAGSYFVSRSHETNATNVIPVFCVALAVALRLLPRLDSSDAVVRLVRLTLVPVFSALLAITIGHAPGLIRFLTDPRPAHRATIEALLPRADAALRELLATVPIGAEEPVAYIGPALNPLPPRPVKEQPGRETSRHRAWLPLAPPALFLPLPEERGRTYVERFVGRARLGGWLIEWKPYAPRFEPLKRRRPPPGLPWLAEVLRGTHTVTAVHENDAWRLRRFELR
jgi:hypothetical protein